MLDSHAMTRFLPPWCQPYAALMRLDRPIGTWLLLLPCWWGFFAHFTWEDPTDLWYALLFAPGALLLRGAGCVWNDIADRDLDRQVARTANRPLALGQVSVPQALVFMAVLLVPGAVILAQFPQCVILWGLAAMLLVLPYPLMKRITWWPQLWLGLTFNWGVWLGALTIEPVITPGTIVLYGAGVFWTLGYDTIYALQDIDDDRKAGIKSTARRLGLHTTAWIAGFYTLTTVCLCGALALESAWLTSLAMLVPAAHLLWQVRALATQSTTPGALFRSNRNFALAVVLVLILL